VRRRRRRRWRWCERRRRRSRHRSIRHGGGGAVQIEGRVRWRRGSRSACVNCAWAWMMGAADELFKLAEGSGWLDVQGRESDSEFKCANTPGLRTGLRTGIKCANTPGLRMHRKRRHGVGGLRASVNIACAHIRNRIANRRFCQFGRGAASGRSRPRSEAATIRIGSETSQHRSVIELLDSIAMSVLALTACLTPSRST
jgi:hypothetical protein